MGRARQTAARLIDQRARRRATQALIDLHRDEFRDLYEWHRRNATDEAQTLAVKVEDDGEVDEIAVERALRGDAVAMTRREVDEALARMVERGDSDRQIADALGISDRTVIRRRQRLGLESRWTA